MYHHSNTNARFRQPPSFSATLLDKIYRSIDEPESDRIRKQSSRTKQNPHRNDKEDPLFYSSNSSSSNSSSLGLSSSDTESIYGVQPKLRAASAFLPPPPKPVRITVPSRSEKQRRVSTPLVDSQIFSTAEAIHDEGIIKSKSRALRIYANLKKAKTPISPGGRLSSFINSLFTPANGKKSKHSPSIHNVDDVNVEKTSNCSSTSSFSRSCLSNKSPGRRNAAKRSVRFLNEDLKPGGRKFLSEDSGRFQKKKNNLIDDDASSCSSSDLFELDHLSVMGMDSRYCEELPVYQTTHFRVR